MSLILFPLPRILRLALMTSLLIVILSAPFANYDDALRPGFFSSETNTQPTTTTTTRSSTQPTDSFTETATNTVADTTMDNVAVTGGFNLDFLDVIPILAFRTLIMLAILGLLGIALYGLLFNSEALQLYVNMQLRLAKLQYRIGFAGRSWQIMRGVTMSISGVHGAKVFFKLPAQHNYLDFGFIRQDQYVVTSCQLVKLQLMLQLIQRYLGGYTIKSNQ